MIKHVLIALGSVVRATQPSAPAIPADEGLPALLAAQILLSVSSGTLPRVDGPDSPAVLVGDNTADPSAESTGAKRDRDDVEPSDITEVGTLPSVPKRRRTADDEVVTDVASSSAPLILRDWEMVSHRKEIITQVLLESVETADRRIFQKIRAILREDPITDEALQGEIADCAGELGIKIRRSTRASETACEQRQTFVENFVSDNNGIMADGAMVPLINALLIDGGITEVEPDELVTMVRAARTKLGIPAPGGDGIQALLAADVSLSDSSVPPSQLKRGHRVADNDSSVKVVLKGWWSKLQRIRRQARESKGPDSISHSRYYHSQMRREIIRDYLISVNGVRDTDTIPSIELALRLGGVPPVSRSTIREIICEMCHQMGYPVTTRRSGLESNRRRSALVEEYIKSNPDLDVPSLVNGSFAILKPEGLDNVLWGSLRDLVRVIRKRLNGDGSVARQQAARGKSRPRRALRTSSAVADESDDDSEDGVIDEGAESRR